MKMKSLLSAITLAVVLVAGLVLLMHIIIMVVLW